MKNWFKKNLLAICTGGLALGLFLPLPDVSTFFFGEPDFPFED